MRQHLQQLQYYAMFSRKMLQKHVRARLDAALAPDGALRRDWPREALALERAIAAEKGGAAADDAKPDTVAMRVAAWTARLRQRLTRARAQTGEDVPEDDAARNKVAERVAAIWFNRLCALRYMELNGYLPMRVTGRKRGEFLPDILERAKEGVIDETLVDEPRRRHVLQLLDVERPGPDRLNEAYQTLLLAVSDAWRDKMPFLFAPPEDAEDGEGGVGDYITLLLPDGMLWNESFRHLLAHTLYEEQCDSVELFEWLYQFYGSQQKNDIFKALRPLPDDERKLAPEEIVTVTHLSTPDYIARHLTQNSLGRLWLQNHPRSRLANSMRYFIRPTRQGMAADDFARLGAPEELRVLDPVCGAGRMLACAFDVLYDIYAERGDDPAGIPASILRHNLHGMELSQRAGQLAALTLTLKARERNADFFAAPVQPNICVWQNTRFAEGEAESYFAALGRGELLTDELRELLRQFAEVETIGSLLPPPNADVVESLAAALAVDDAPMAGDSSLQQTRRKLQRVLRQARFLAQKYHVVLANPPGIGENMLPDELKDFAAQNYPDSAADLYAMFMAQARRLSVAGGVAGMLTMDSWLRQPKFAKTKVWLQNDTDVLSVAHLGAHAIETIESGGMKTAAVVWQNGAGDGPASRGDFFDLQTQKTPAQKQEALLAIAAGNDDGLRQPMTAVFAERG